MDILKNDEQVVADDERYVMASPGIMVAHDRSALNEYYKKATLNRQRLEELNTVKDDVARLTDEVSDLKQLILDLHRKLEDKH